MTADVVTGSPSCVAGHPVMISRAIVVDDHPLFRSGLRLLIQSLDATVAVLEAADVSELSGASGGLTEARICFLDLDLRETRGLQTLNRMRCILPAVPVVVVSQYRDPELIHACIERGAMGYVCKNAAPDRLIEALQRILGREVYLPPESLQDRTIGEAAGLHFTRRQRDVLAGLVEGLSTKAIALRLHLSAYTVKEHLAELYHLLGVHTRTQAVIAASRMTVGVRVDAADGPVAARRDPGGSRGEP